MQTQETCPSPFDDGELYDLLFLNFDFGLKFYLDLAKAVQGPVLDVACGTGRILLPCLQGGLEADGLDLYAPMLATARKKAAQLGFQPRLIQSDMSAFHLDRHYGLIVIAFNAFLHNLTAETQLSTLACCRQHLLPDGILAFDTSFPGTAWVTAPDNVRVFECEMKHPVTNLPVRLYDTRSFDRVRQIQRSENEMELLDAEGKITQTFRSQTSIRWIYKSEMELLLRLTGFRKWEIYGNFERQPLERETDMQIVQAWN